MKKVATMKNVCILIQTGTMENKLTTMIKMYFESRILLVFILENKLATMKIFLNLDYYTFL